MGPAPAGGSSLSRRVPGVEEILQRRPFAGLLEIASLEPLGIEHGFSGTAFRLTDRDGRNFKLRVCSWSGRARNLERYLNGLPGVFPSLVAREGRLLLLEYLDGYRTLMRLELLRRAKALGRIGALAHQAGSRPEVGGGRARRRLVSFRWKRQFQRDLALLARSAVLPPASRRGAEQKFHGYLERFGLPVELELDDLHKANFVYRETDRDLRYVDEEGVGLRPKGLGMASFLKTVKKRVAWDRYREGYAQVADASFLTAEYTEYLLLQDAVRRVARKVRLGNRLHKVPEELSHIRAMADRDDVDLAWRFARD